MERNELHMESVKAHPPRVLEIQLIVGHMPIQTTERYLGRTQRIASPVNDEIGIEPAP
ncbi:MAG: hypothetical protein LAP87_02280 [Acidobacteriia bacterium]|nr:hypothetical protein [Terriglobia bacterium]